jgi:hypothetical protein
MSRHCHTCDDNGSFNKLKVCKDARFRGNLDVAKDVEIFGDLKVSGTTSLTDVEITGDIQLSGNQAVGGDVSVSGSVTVTECVSADGLVLDEKQEKPCGDNNNVVWVKGDNLMFTDKNGQDNIVQTVKDNPDYQLVKGRWVLQTKKRYDQEAVFEFLDLYEDPDYGTAWRIKVLGGIRSQIAELTQEQLLLYPFQESIIPGYPVDGDLKRIWIAFPPDGFLLTANNGTTFKIQDYNPEEAIYCVFNDFIGVTQSNIPRILRFKKQHELQPVQPYNEANLYGQEDFTDPLFIFNYAFSIISQENNPELAKDANTVGYQGFLPFIAWKNKLIDEGVVRKSEVLNVLKSQSNPVSARFGFTTTITTKCPHNLSRSSDVTLDGFAGEYSILNGTFPVTLIDYLNSSYPAPYQSPSSYIFTFNIPVDTSKLSTFDAAKHINGVATVVARHGPVKNIAGNPNDDYRQLLACIYELQAFIGISTHQLFQPIVTDLNSAVVPKSFREISNLVKSRTFNNIYGSGVSAYSAVFNTRRIGDCGQWNVNGSLFNGTGLIQPVLTNNPYNIFPSRNSLWDYNIVQNTYLEPGTLRYTFGRIVGTPIGAPGSNISWFMNLNNWKNQGGTGSTFEFKAVDPLNLPPASENWQFIGGSTPSNVNTIPSPTSQFYFYGLIRKEFTNGEKVGYLRIANFIDVRNWSSFSDANDGPLAAPTNQYLKMWSAAIQYFNSQGVTRIIFDNRNNSGGLVNNVNGFAQLFGVNRGYLVDSLVDRNNGNKTPEVLSGKLQTANHPDGIQDVLDNCNILQPDEVAAALGEEAVFRGNDSVKKVITVLTSKSAGSGGDLDVTGIFVSPNPQDSTNLGSNTYAKIIGTIDGRVFSSSGQQQCFPTDSSYNLITSDGIPVSPIRLTCEQPNLLTYVDQRTQKYFNNQVSQWAPHVLLDDSYNIVYRNLGYQPLRPGPADGYLLPDSSFIAIGRTGIPVPGNPNDPATWNAARLSWRDIWLETAITNGNF